MTDEQTAAAIVADHLEVAEDYNGADLCGYVMRGSFHQTAAKALDDKVALVDAIVRALQQARDEAGRDGFKAGYMAALDTHANAAVLRMCHEARMCNGIVDYSDPNATGVVRRVLGHLAITKDGWVIGDDCRVWQDGQMWNTELFRVPTESNGRWAPYRTNKVYSSETAESAKEAK